MDPIVEPTTSDLTAGTHGTLIAASKVSGTRVYGADEERIGEVLDLMIDKWSGKVEYAVLTFGGFLGLGTKEFALPWRMLRYEPRLEGFVVAEITRERLDMAPVHDAALERNWGSIDNYWGV